MNNITQPEEQKILCTVVHKMARLKMIYYSLFLLVIVFCILNFFNIVGERSLIKDIGLIVLAIASFIYGKRYKRACGRLYHREYDFERGKIADFKKGKPNAKVIVNGVKTEKKYPILYVLDEKQENNEERDCLLVKVFKDKKYIVLL